MSGPSLCPFDKQEMFVSVTPSVTFSLEGVYKFAVDKRECYTQSERELRFFRHYTFENCFMECFANYTFEASGAKRSHS